MRIGIAIILTLISTMFVAAAPAAEQGEILGRWRTEGEKSQVEIYRCSGDRYCARIVWLKEPTCTDPKDGPIGAPKTDTNNPDPARRSRPLVGLQFMEGFVSNGENRWEGGTIYDPENGKTYRCRMKLAERGRLEVRGFIGISLLGRTTVWTR